MTIFHPAIDDYLRRSTVLSLFASAEGTMWAANVFYCLDPELPRLLYYTSPETEHGRLSAANPEVAAAVAMQGRDASRLQGLQLRGRTVQLEGAEADRAREAFAEAFPEIGVNPGPIWALTPSAVKLVDNTQGFGHKEVWPSA